MSRAMRNVEKTNAIAADMVALFDASGDAYTCQAAILRVIERPAVIASNAAAREGYVVRWRRVVNLAADTIHKKRYPPGANI